MADAGNSAFEHMTMPADFNRYGFGYNGVAPDL